jgi:NAD(P)-dependent dehydrogenase (short-subunit alcohol dehydrogenase family)
VNVRYPEFSGQTVIVTGAAAGIGRAVARGFAAEGATVAALDINEAGLTSLAKATDGRVSPLVVDVTDEAALRATVARVISELGAPRVLVNNAGVDRRHGFDDLTLAEWHRSLALNLDHHFILSQAVAPHMQAAGGGAIVNLSSTAFMKLAPNLTSYHTAKAGIVGLTKGMARDLGPLGIRVNAIAPGRVVTARVRGTALTPEWERQTRELQCLPELIMPEDIAQAALWLASSGARCVTGQTLVVDGGVV